MLKAKRVTIERDHRANGYIAGWNGRVPGDDHPEYLEGHKQGVAAAKRANDVETFAARTRKHHKDVRAAAKALRDAAPDLANALRLARELACTAGGLRHDQIDSLLAHMILYGY
jgi:hypothetical protein